MNIDEKILKEKLIYKGSFLDILNVDVELPNGKSYSRDVVRHPGATAIIAFLDDENIILVEQFRLPLNKKILEIPAGKINKNEDIKECAKRELQEETGYIAGNLEYLGYLEESKLFISSADSSKNNLWQGKFSQTNSTTLLCASVLYSIYR